MRVREFKLVVTQWKPLPWRRYSFFSLRQMVPVELQMKQHILFPEYALDILTHEKAIAVIKVYDEAISKESSFRSKLCATQSRLEHTISYIRPSVVNLISVESRIRYIDLAKEMMS